MTEEEALREVASARDLADAAGDAYARARADLKAAIVRAVEDSPATYRQIAEAASMTAGRVGQLVEATRAARGSEGGMA